MNKQYFVAIGVITNEKGDILLSQRDDTLSPYSHKKWQLPGGGVDHGEHPKEALIREIEEETGIKIAITNNHPKVFSHVFLEKNTHVVILAYPAVYVSGTIDISQDEDTADAKWFAYDTIDFSTCLPLTKDIIDEIRKAQ